MSRHLILGSLAIMVSGCFSEIPQQPYGGFVASNEVSNVATLVGVIDKEIPLVRLESYVGFCGADAELLSGDYPNVIYMPPGKHSICVTYITPALSHPVYRKTISFDIKPSETYTVSAKGRFMGYDYSVHDQSGKQIYPD